MDDLVAAWEATDPGRSVEPSYGSSGNFLAQIKEGAPFDVFFSADAAYPRELERAGLADVGSTRLYAIGQIVVWVANDSALDVETRGLDVLTDPSVKAVAIANPEHAPYGRAAVAAMTSAGIYDSVNAKLVLGENVSQAAQFVESGNADAGIVALALAVAPTLSDLGRYATIPIDSYPRLEQGAVVLDSAIDRLSAQAFLDFVLGSGGRAILDRYGFLAPPP
jgi:molybdate transport system substrate-binding protein